MDREHEGLGPERPGVPPREGGGGRAVAQHGGSADDADATVVDMLSPDAPPVQVIYRISSPCSPAMSTQKPTPRARADAFCEMA